MKNYKKITTWCLLATLSSASYVYGMFTEDDAFSSNLRSRHTKKKISSKNEDCVLITLSPTKLPRIEEEKEFSNDFSYHWKVNATSSRKKFLSTRAYAEGIPFVELTELMKIPTNMPSHQQYSVRFTDQDIRTVLELYGQGKLSLTWSDDTAAFDHLKVSQYCATPSHFLNTLAVTSHQKDRTYYKQQRYINRQRAQTGDVFLDSQRQIEYWFDAKKKRWVVDHPDPEKGEVTYLTHEKAIKAMTRINLSYGPDDETHYFFLDPYKRWMRDELEKTHEESSSPSLWKTVFIGWLALTGDVFGKLLNAPTYNSATDQPEETQQSLVTRLSINQEQKGLGIFEEYGNSLISSISNFVPYAVVSPLLMSFLSSRGGRIDARQFLFTALSIIPVIRAETLKIQPENQLNEEGGKNKEGGEVTSIIRELKESYKDHYTWEHHPRIQNPTQGYSYRLWRVPIGPPVSVDGHLFQPMYESRDTNKEPHKLRVYDPTQWDHQDQHKQSYPLGEVYLWDNKKNVNETIDSSIKIHPPMPHIPKEKYAPTGSVKWVHENECPKPWHHFQRERFYVRPDGTRYDIFRDNPQEFPLNRIAHENIISLHDYSYQVITLELENEVMGYQPLLKSYHAKMFQYSHRQSYTLIENDDNTRTCTYNVETYIIPNKLQCGFLGTHAIKFAIKEEKIFEEYKYIKEDSRWYYVATWHFYARCSEAFGGYDNYNLLSYNNKLPDKKIRERAEL